MEYITGGICAPQGFKGNGVHCGFYKDENKKDLGIIVSERLCAAAAVYTTNKVYGAPITVNQKHLADGHAQVIICNSGIANTCAPNGPEIAEDTCRLAARALSKAAGNQAAGGSGAADYIVGASNVKALSITPENVIVASTGVIGEALTMKPFEKGIGSLVSNLGDADENSQAVAGAIMTTDTVCKEVAVSFHIGGKECRLGAIAKGSGMIHPNMATMLSFITGDVAISPEMLQKALSYDVDDTYNQISVDGDTSTNDMVVVMANGLAGNREITGEGADYDEFCEALRAVTKTMAMKIAGDGEGASKLIICKVKGADTKVNARLISKSVISSNLTKAAIFGKDANWGRIICAVGYTPGNFGVSDIDICLGSETGQVQVCKKSAMVEFSEKKALEILEADEITIDIDMNDGGETAEAYGCDLTYEYVTINASYRS